MSTEGAEKILVQMKNYELRIILENGERGTEYFCNISLN